MREIESRRVKAEPGHGAAERIGGVEIVPENRMSDRLEVKPELMASSGQWREFDSGDRHSRIGAHRGEHIVQVADLSAARHHPASETRFSVFEIDHLSWRIVEVLSDREIDLARIFVRMSADQRVIGLLRLPVLELAAQLPV